MMNKWDVLSKQNDDLRDKKLSDLKKLNDICDDILEITNNILNDPKEEQNNKK